MHRYLEFWSILFLIVLSNYELVDFLLFLLKFFFIFVKYYY